MRAWLVALVGLAIFAGPAPGPAEELPKAGQVVTRVADSSERVDRYSVAEMHRAAFCRVDQDGVDVVLALVDREGSIVREADSPNGRWGPEWLRLPEAAAGYTLEVRVGSAQDGGGYRLAVKSLDEAAPEIAPEIAPGIAVMRALASAATNWRSGSPEERQEALRWVEQALAVAESASIDPQLRAESLLLVGVLRRVEGEVKEAVAPLQAAFHLWTELDDVLGQARALSELGLAQWRNRQTEPAAESLGRSVTLWRELGDRAMLSQALEVLGVAQIRSAPGEAIGPLREALDLARALGEESRQAAIHTNLGGAYDQLAEPVEALAQFHAALDLRRRLGQERYVAGLWNNIASVARRAGQLQEAVDGYRRALDLTAEGDAAGRARILNNLGTAYRLLGDGESATDCLRRSLKLRRKAEDRRGEAVTLANLARVLLESGRPGEALEALTIGDGLAEKLGHASLESSLLLIRARAASELGDHEAAQAAVSAAQDRLAELDLPWREGQAWLVAGEVRLRAGDGSAALALAEKAAERMARIDDGAAEVEALGLVARARRAEGRLDAAWTDALQALERLEGLRVDLEVLDLRMSFFARRGSLYELAVQLALDLHRRDPGRGWAARALEVSERARARSLLDLLQRAEQGASSADSERLRRRGELLSRLSAKVETQRRRVKRRGPQVSAAEFSAEEELAAEIRDLRRRLEADDRELHQFASGVDSPIPAPIAAPIAGPITAADMQALLDDETILLEYFLGEERSFVWLVSRERIDVAELAPRVELEALARNLYEAWRIQDPGARTTDRHAALRLAKSLFPGALLEVDPTARRLAIVPAGALHYVPFAALPGLGGGEPLIRRFEVVSLHSASALAAQRRLLNGRQAAERGLVVIADPVLRGDGPEAEEARERWNALRDTRYRGVDLQPLPWSRWEADALAARSALAGGPPARVVRGLDAHLDWVRDGGLRGYRWVHFATHGVVDNEQPELSALILSRYDRNGLPIDGSLRLGEILHLRLDADLVVLSGCGTALGLEVRGEGLVGLTQGFFAAGARRLVASLWRVQDRATAELMDRFYERLLAGETVPPSQALRTAQLDWIDRATRENGTADPYEWAAFAAFGDWQ